MKMDLTMLPSKKTRAEWCLGVLMIAQGNSVIELSPDQAQQLARFVKSTSKPSSVDGSDKRDLG